jgi:ribonuclease BN (tRNA processing enzyme)
MLSVHVMGSGSANFLQYRAKSAMVVRLFSEDDQSIALIDCGSKNLLSLRKDDFSKTRRIFITHTHSDHILYLGWVLRKIKKASDNPKVKLFYPAEKERFLRLFIRACFLGRIPRFIEFLSDNEKKQLSFQSDEIIKIDKLQNTEVWACRAAHRTPSLCYAFKNPDLKITFPVDTVAGFPSIQKLGQNSCIFFHESTFPNKNKRWAKKSMHSTPSTAVIDALRSNSNHLALTHIADMRFGHRSLFKKTSQDIETTEEAILKQAAERLTLESIPFQTKESTKAILELKNYKRTILVVRDLDTFVFKNRRLLVRRQATNFRTRYIQY